MAITKTKELIDLTVVRVPDAPTTLGGNPEAQPPHINARYAVIVDDPEDDQLPIRDVKHYLLTKQTVSYDDNGNETIVDTDLTDHDQLVQDIAAVVWA